MKKIYFSSLLLPLLICFITTTPLKAQTFKLNDINTSTNSNPSNFQNYYKDKFAYLNGSFYFRADDGIHGGELFRSDVKTGATYLVKDIEPGIASSNIQSITTAGGRLYFFTSPGNTGQQFLWVSDGTDYGTKQITNLPAAQFGNFSFLTDAGGVLYFTYNYYDNTGSYYQLFKVAAGSTNATLVSNIGRYVAKMVSSNGKLFFTADYNSGAGLELYTTDGTAQGTKLLSDINNNPYMGSNPNHLTPLNGLLYFAADDGNGNKLWVSNGTAAGTKLARNNGNIIIAPEYGDGSDYFGNKNGTLFLSGQDIYGPSTGYELCKYNTTDPKAIVTFVKDIVTGNIGSTPRNFATAKSVLYFTADLPNKAAQLWKSDGTAAGTILVKDIDPGQPNSFSSLLNANSTLLFIHYNAATGNTLWKTDGTPKGTLMVKDIDPGPKGGDVTNITHEGNTNLFSANGPAGVELWKTDGTAAGTLLVKDINISSNAGSYPVGFTALNAKTLFIANNGKTNGNIYVDDPSSAAKPILLDSALLGFGVSNKPTAFTIFKNEAYFLDPDLRVWKTNGTKAGTVQLPIPAISNPDSSFITEIVAADNLLYFFSFGFNTSQISLWRTDGTAKGTFTLKSDIPYLFNTYPTAIGNTLYFPTVDNTLGTQLWKTDGTVAGTGVVKTFGDHNPYNSIGYLYNFKNKLYLIATDPLQPANGPFIWTSDGTDKGTVPLGNYSVQQEPFAEANGKLFFYGRDNNNSSFGNELYATNGAPGGEYLVKDINPGWLPSNAFVSPSPLISGNKFLYFVANNDINGTGLWRSDGTDKGTIFLSKAAPGFYREAVSKNDLLYYVADNGEFWISDGTVANTHPLNDAVLTGVTSLRNLAVIGNSLYISGHTDANGDELYIADLAPLSSTGKRAAPLFSIANAGTNEISLKLSPDPVQNILQVNCKGLTQGEAATILIASNTGIIFKTQSSKNLSQGERIDVSLLPRGAYIVKIITANKILVSQFIKL
ncbi:hypothetical protein BH11BAC3_BH11BAC3_06900 [soil metagenome]